LAPHEKNELFSQRNIILKLKYEKEELRRKNLELKLELQHISQLRNLPYKKLNK